MTRWYGTRLTAISALWLMVACTGQIDADDPDAGGVTPPVQMDMTLAGDMSDGSVVPDRDLGGMPQPDGGIVIPDGGLGEYSPPPLDDAPITPTALDAQDSLGRVGLRRLSRRELDFTLGDIFQISPRSSGALDLYPPDSGDTTAFDNVYAAQSISINAIESFEEFAELYARDMVSSDNRNKLIGRRGADCAPTGPDDAQCLGKFLTWAGGRMFRRDITAAERDRWVARLIVMGQEDGDFFSALDWSLRMLLQHPEFLYRVERSTDPDTVTALDEFEIASRMAYFIWGQGPNPMLLDAARAGRLSDPVERAQIARDMLDNSRATDQFLAFHQSWLRYSVENIPLGTAGRDDMLIEIESLILRIIEDDGRNWFDLLRAQETYVSPALASLYGLPSPGAGADWVAYDATRGGGVLSHAAYLQTDYKVGFDDVSPTLRGYHIYKNFLCGETLADKIPDGVDETAPPAGQGCKTDRYNMRQIPACSGCHLVTDGLGFGLDQYDHFGVVRTHDKGDPNCAISGEGDLLGEPFNGTRELGPLLAEHNAFRRCASKQLYRFLMGRPETSEDAQIIEAIAHEQSEVLSLKNLMVSIVQSPAFITKKGDKP